MSDKFTPIKSRKAPSEFRRRTLKDHAIVSTPADDGSRHRIATHASETHFGTRGADRRSADRRKTGRQGERD